MWIYHKKKKEINNVYSEMDKMEKKGFGIMQLQKFVNRELKNKQQYDARVFTYLEILGDKKLTEKISILHRPDIKKYIEDTLGIDLKQLNIREQVQFLKFITTTKEKDVFDKTKNVLRVKDINKISFLRTFLSLEQGGLEMGKKILNIGEKFKETPEVANAIFEKYAELVDAVDGVEDYLKEQFGKEDPKLIQEIKENLLIRGKAILVMFADEEMTMGVAMERLKEIDTGVDILGATLRIMKNNGEKVDLNIVKDLSILSVYKLDENAINNVMVLAEDSWDQNAKNNGVSADFAKVVMNGLRGDLESDRIDTEINVLKYQDKPIGMIRFQTVDDKTLVVKSVNIHSQLKGINIGTFLFELIRKKAQEKNLKLDVLLKNQVSCHYISEVGFQGYGYNDNVKETNEPNIYAKLEKGKIKNRDDKYFTKQEGDIERNFNISTQKGLKEMRNFLKEYLLAVNDKGDIIDGQKHENKYTIVEQVQIGGQEDIRKIILRKNSVL
jgi:N-acetylglutamate synthase-like GNAT family acetyltransferase